MAKVKDLKELGIGTIKERGRLRFEKPSLIVSCKNNSFEDCPQLKAEAAVTYCHGMVLGYKLDADGKTKVWQKVGTAGGPTEKQARGVLIASSVSSEYAYKSDSAFKTQSIHPWRVLVRDAVVVGGLLREDGSKNKVDDNKDYNYYAPLEGYNDYSKRAAELENYCNIKVSEPMVTVSDVADKPGDIT